MQVGEQNLARAQHGDLGRLRLLDLDDQVGRREHRAGRFDDRRAGRAVGFIARPDAGAGIVLHDDLVAVLDQFTNTGRGQPHAIFVGLDFLWNADLHVPAPAR